MPDRNWACRIKIDLTWKGWRALSLENEVVKITLLLDKGSDIVEFLHKPSDTDFMWFTPWGLQKKDSVQPSTNGDNGVFGDLYEGGWQDIFPSGGVKNRHQGVDYGLHGETPGLPWEASILKDSEDEIAVQLECHTYRTPFRLRKTLTLKKGQAALFIEEEIKNLGESTVDTMWGHHPAFGKPFLGPDCRIDLPGATAIFDAQFSETPRFQEGARGPWPRLKGKDGNIVDLSRFPDPSKRSADMFYLTDLKAGWYGLTNTKKKVGFGMAWDIKTFPHIWYWQVYGGGLGSPWWGRTYNCALEPFSSIPSGLANAAKAGTALKFKAGQSRKTWLTAVAYDGMSKVKKVGRDGKVS